MDQRLTILASLLIALSCASMRNDPGYNGGVIDELVLGQLKTESTVNVFVKLWGDADLSRVSTQNIEKRAATTFETLSNHASTSQHNLLQFLASRALKYESFWIINAVYVWGVDETIVRELSQRADVEVIRGDRHAELLVPVGSAFGTALNHTSKVPAKAVEEYMELIGATAVWKRGFTGQGVVIAGIDTGVRWTHISLRDSYRGGDYAWFDPRASSALPIDTHGHGTHTMGTMVGSLASGVGVAYGAKWIAARGCVDAGCATYDLTASAQWVVCPNPPSCSEKPHIVNNSWGGGQDDTWYLSYINAWRAANILPVFAIGNSGPNCSTARSPADNEGAFSVGGSDMSNDIGIFSSRGPGRLVAQKPDIIAPGVNINSAWYTSDTAYMSISATSMATPHISGAAALLISSRPGISILSIESSLRSTTFKDMQRPSTGLDTCGGVSYNTYPNYIYGHGRVQVDAAVSYLHSLE
eukprot:TRINITY_DN1951_c0_g1_i1.p1 TRINITY_DN1951_c0_g1~~TRINITY_DN1951_c0_g1_i1.p1  ORF type:complete len:471 (+),score=65.26 TRINITY_DN1951_c0_g1_i1:51-1463(+)